MQFLFPRKAVSAAAVRGAVAVRPAGEGGRPLDCVTTVSMPRMELLRGDALLDTAPSVTLMTILQVTAGPADLSAVRLARNGVDSYRSLAIVPGKAPPAALSLFFVEETSLAAGPQVCSEARGVWLYDAAAVHLAVLVGSAPTRLKDPRPGRCLAAVAGSVTASPAVVVEESVDGVPLDEVFASVGGE